MGIDWSELSTSVLLLAYGKAVTVDCNLGRLVLGAATKQKMILEGKKFVGYQGGCKQVEHVGMQFRNFLFSWCTGFRNWPP